MTELILEEILLNVKFLEILDVSRSPGLLNSFTNFSLFKNAINLKTINLSFIDLEYNQLKSLFNNCGPLL